MGEIYTNDNTYNAVHWDGEKWELKRILYDGYTWPIKSVFAFTSDDVWFDAFVRFNQGTFKQMPIPDVLIGWGKNKIWGTSSSDLYVVGNEGKIAHYDGHSWAKVETNTDLDIVDIWGMKHAYSGEMVILCVGSDYMHSRDRVIYQIKGLVATELPSSPIQWALNSIWFDPGNRYFAAGTGIYHKHDISTGNWFGAPLKITNYHIFRLRGNGINDVIATGGFGEILHFNGMTWKSYLSNTEVFHGNFYSADYKNNIAAVVGVEVKELTYVTAVIRIGKR